MRSHYLNDRIGNLCKERFSEAQLGAKTNGTAQDQATNRVTPFGSRQDPIRYHEDCASDVVSNDAIRHPLFSEGGIIMLG